MTPRYKGEYLFWVQAAEEALKLGNYENAATHLRRVADYLWLIGDRDGFKVFARKACACYLEAAEGLWEGNERLRACSLYRTAANYLREIGDEPAAARYNSLIQEYYRTLVVGDFADFKGQARDLKRVGDYFKVQDNHVDAGKCYERAAELAVRDGRPLLAGGLYRDAGDCYRRMESHERAVEVYEKAADNYFLGEGYFEAAWHYNLCGFIAVSMKRLEKAGALAKKAWEACAKGNIAVLLNDLTLICKHLSERHVSEAQERWNRIRGKFRESYVNLVESSFQALT